MKIDYQQTPAMAPGEIEIQVRSREKTYQVNRLLHYLENFTGDHPTNIPIKGDDKIIVIKLTELLMVEVTGNELTIYTTNQLLHTAGHLKDIQARLVAPQFIQVSRHAVINMEYLQTVENSFSGTMVAHLANGVKTVISRKFVPVIKDYLGL